MLWTCLIATPKKGWQFWRPHPRDFWYIGSEINEADVSVFVLICQQEVRMTWGLSFRVSESESAQWNTRSITNGCYMYTWFAVRDDKTGSWVFWTLVCWNPPGKFRLYCSYKLWNMGDFICLERHLEARGISVDSLRCMTIDALTSGKF